MRIINLFITIRTIVSPCHDNREDSYGLSGYHNPYDDAVFFHLGA